jgi:glutathione S-transferase
MKVYGHPLSTCTRKVLMTLEEKGATADVVTLDLLAGEHRAPAHLARHPFAKIPVLDDDGFMLFESRAILRYLDARLERSPLTPASARARARMEQWLSVDQAYVSPHLTVLVGELVVKKMLGAEVDGAAVERARADLGKALAAIDDALTTPFLAGDTFSLADVSLLPYVAALPMVASEHLVANTRRLSGWFERVAARPAWRAVAARTA